MACVDGYCRPEDPTECTEPPVEWAAVQVGAFHTCGLSTFGDALCWGSNAHSQLGLVSVDQVATPTRIADMKWIALAVGAEHTCGIDPNGVALCWGEDEQGQVKGETGTQFATPTRVVLDPSKTAPAFEQITAGSRHTCAIGAGQLWCWGLSSVTGVPDAPFATRIGTMDNWTQISAGYDHTCGIAGGQAYCWGANTYGQVAAPGTESAPLTQIALSGVISIVAGDGGTCAIANAAPGAKMGELYCWGRNSERQLDDTGVASGIPKRMGVLDTWTSVDVGDGVNCVTGTSGMTCWGRSYSGAIGQGLWSSDHTFDEAAPRIGMADEVSLGTGQFAVTGSSFACSRLGTSVSCWGANPNGELGIGVASRHVKPVAVAPPMGTTWTGVWSGGGEHVCATTSANELYCWGADDRAQISAGIARGATNPCLPTEPCNAPRPTKAPPDITRFDDLVLGNTYTCMRDGTTIKCWGASPDGALGANLDRGFANVLAPAGQQWTKLWGGRRGNCGLTGNGKVACWGDIGGTYPSRPSVQMSTEVHDISDADIGDDAICLTRSSDNARVCWGRNDQCQVGDATNVAVAMPKPLDIGAVSSMVMTNTHGCYITLTGTVKCWGSNYYGAVGVVPGPSPQTVSAPVDVVDANMAPLTDCTKVISGSFHSCALCGGTVQCWGEALYAATGVPQTMKPGYVPAPISITGKTFVDVVARSSGGCARTADGEIYCWGSGGMGGNGDGGQDRNVPTDITTRF